VLPLAAAFDLNAIPASAIATVEYRDRDETK